MLLLAAFGLADSSHTYADRLQFKEREALRGAHPLTWAECLRQRARVEGQNQLRKHRDTMIERMRTVALTADDVAGCAELIRDEALDCGDADQLEELCNAIAESLTANAWHATSSGSIASSRWEEAWIVVGLRSFDAVEDAHFLTVATPITNDIGQSRAGALITVLESASHPSGPDPRSIQKLEDGASALGQAEPRVAAEVRSFVAYVRWAFDRARTSGYVPFTGDGEPTKSKVDMATMLMKPKRPNDTGLLETVRDVLDQSNCPRWALDAALIIHAEPSGFDLEERRDAYDAAPKWYDTRRFMWGDEASVRHSWWFTEPPWRTIRRDLETQIDQAIEHERFEDAFQLLQQAKCAPLEEPPSKSNGTPEFAARNVRPASSQEFTKRFSIGIGAHERPYYQHAYVEIYWGEKEKGFFHIVRELGANAQGAAGQFVASALEYKPFANPNKIKQQIDQLVMNLRNGKATGTAGLCQQLLPIMMIDVDSRKHICNLQFPRIMIAPDGPFWGFPFELVLKSAPAAGQAYVSYSPTAAALIAANHVVTPADWYNCWKANYSHFLGDYELPEAPWLVEYATDKNFPLALVSVSAARPNNELTDRVSRLGGSNLSFAKLVDLRGKQQGALSQAFGDPLAFILVETGPVRR